MLVQDFDVVLKPVDKSRLLLVLSGDKSHIHTTPVLKGIKRKFRVMFQTNTVMTHKGTRRITTCILFTGYVPLGYGVAVQCPKDKADSFYGHQVAMKKAISIAVTNMLVDGNFTEHYRVRKWLGTQVIRRNNKNIRVASDQDLYGMISDKLFSAWKTKYGRMEQYGLPIARETAPKV